ncbi:MAG: ribonuclease PH [Elusimicrobia bacterium]|nr:ribonuclease PH [Elusimicrobiota bacterium]
MRSIKITPNYLKFGDGSCLIEMGETKIICASTIEEGRIPPHCEAKNTGWVTAEYSMLPRSAKQRTPRARNLASGRTHEIQRLIGRALRSVVNLDIVGKRTIIVDCDAVQADGGTRTASVNGAFIAMCLAFQKLQKEKKIIGKPVLDYLGAISAGIVRGKKILDLSAEEDNIADVDMNVVMTGDGHFVEVQSTAEGSGFTLTDMEEMLALARKGIKQIIELEKRIIKI